MDLENISALETRLSSEQYQTAGKTAFRLSQRLL